jgi:hypothetical protein
MLELLGIPDLWQQVVDYFTISPWWVYLFWGVIVCIFTAALAWFFPPLRSLAGAVIMTIGGMLYAYRRGEQDTEQREKERREREQQRPQNQDKWWW